METQIRDDFNEELIKQLKEYGADTIAIQERFQQDMGIYRICLEDFFKDESIERLGTEIEEKQYEAAFRTIHSIKGVSANMGLMPLYEMAGQMMDSLKADDNTNLKLQYAHFCLEYNRAKEMLLQ